VTVAVAYERTGPAPRDPRATEHMVPTRDGVRLATDVYLAGGEPAPGPVVLIRLPYDKCGSYTSMPATAAMMTRRGYHVVVQDVRGKFRSEGETVMFAHEAADGSDTIDWIVARPWCDGSVAMWGDSYYGFTQFAAASTGHPALRAIAPRLTGTRLGAVPNRSPGERTSEVEMGVHRLYPCTYFQSHDVFHWEMDWSRRPLVAAVEDWFDTIGHRSPTYDAWLADPEALDRFPFGGLLDAPAIPTLMTIGWWDNCAPWQWDDHDAIAGRPDWAGHEYLLLEPIDHENGDHADLPIGPHHDHTLDPAVLDAALSRAVEPALDFFDVFVRGQGDPADVPRVRYVIAGAPGVRTATAWPPAGSEPVEWFPTADGRLEPTSPPPGELTWVHDPDDPVPSPVENAFAFLAEWPDERALADRVDVLCFDGAAVDADMTLAGPVSFEATVVSTGVECDVFVRLCDVAPDGSAHLVARGQRTVYDATTPCRLVVPMAHVGYLLRAGHALRATVASSDAPEFVVAPGTGEHRWLAVDRVPTTQTISLGGDSPAVVRVTRLGGSRPRPGSRRARDG
jgi:predicted acyl esterase